MDTTPGGRTRMMMMIVSEEQNIHVAVPFLYSHPFSSLKSLHLVKKYFRISAKSELI